MDEEIKRLFTASGGTYGSRRVARDLGEAGWGGVGGRQEHGRGAHGRAGAVRACAETAVA
ncbi:hypothetical protein AB0D04_05195 [Streptomyces sp. NPDC048483]|uniref:hypothetical protein n=1 Tax=Streptomyces sp. NPDC048483 TaxID=3154927 RepID=UPI00343BDA68